MEGVNVAVLSQVLVSAGTGPTELISTSLGLLPITGFLDRLSWHLYSGLLGGAVSDFPIETVFQNRDCSSVIRMKVAAICACLDNQFDSGLEIDEEVEPFLRSVEMDMPNGSKHAHQIDPHAFLYLEPSGNLQLEVSRMLTALKISIDKGQLRTASLRVDMDGVISEIDTWLLTSDFYDWCKTRGIEPGDICSDYDDGEFSISDHAYENASDKRREMEAPHFDANYARLMRQTIESRDYLKEENAKLYLENSLMRQGFVPSEELSNLPLRTRERNVLLSIIAVLCKQAGYDYSRPAKTAGIISGAAELMGVRLSESGIENHLKKIPSALEGRLK